MKKLIFFAGICAWAQVEQPSIGTMLDFSGAARPVLGVAASVTLGDPVAMGVVSMACARSCVIRAESAVIAFDEDSVYVYSAGQLTKDGQTMEIDVAGDVLSMRIVPGIAQLAVRRDDGVWIVRNGNQALAAIPEATGAVMLLPDGVLFASGDETVLRRPNGLQMRFAVRADSFVAMGGGYVQIRSGASSFGLRVVKGKEKMFMLPEVQ